MASSGDRPSPFQRDQIPTAFAAALRRLVRSIPGGVGAAFCDAEGECVDYWGPIDPFDLKIAGAQLAPLHEEMDRRLASWTDGHGRLHLRGDGASYLYLRVSAEYYVVAVLTPFASWWEALGDLEAAVADLRAEAGVG